MPLMLIVIIIRRNFKDDNKINILYISHIIERKKAQYIIKECK